MSQDYGKIWEASLVYGLFIGIQLVRIFSSMLQKGEVNLEKSAITLKYAMDAERICKFSKYQFSVPNFFQIFKKWRFHVESGENIVFWKIFHFWHITFRRPRVFVKGLKLGVGSRKNSCKIGYTCYLFNCRWYSQKDIFRFMKELNVIEMGKKVDIVPHSKRWSPWFFFNLSTLQPINSLYFSYL